MSHPFDVIGYTFDADIYCEDCVRAAGGDPENVDEYGAVFADSESDYPMHCGDCHAYLGGELTSDGVRYVVDAIVEDAIAERDGSPRGACVADWADTFDLGYDRAPTFDRFDVLEAHYAYGVLYHSGGGSKVYARMSSIGAGHLGRFAVQVSPAVVENGYAALSENGRGIYIRLVLADAA